MEMTVEELNKKFYETFSNSLEELQHIKNDEGYRRFVHATIVGQLELALKLEIITNDEWKKLHNKLH